MTDVPRKPRWPRTEEQRQIAREARARYRKRHAEKLRERRKQQYANANHEERREIMALYRERNAEKIRVQQRKYREQHREERNRKHAIYVKFRLSANRGNNGKDLFATITAAVPKGLPAHIRDDVVGTVALLVIDQKADVAKIKELVKHALKTTWGQSDWFKHVSIDEPLGEDFIILDTLVSGHPTPEEALTRRR